MTGRARLILGDLAAIATGAVIAGIVAVVLTVRRVMGEEEP
jgi:hypothetical protein